MLTNAALNRPGKAPGQYPTGGPLPQVLDIWKAGAPSLDLLAPDIYLPDFTAWCDRYQRPGNPLFIPEAHNEPEAAVQALYAIGRGALGFSPFSIENAAEPAAAALKGSYSLLAELAPLIAASKRVEGVLVDKQHPTQVFQFGDLRVIVKHDYTFEWASPARHDPVWPRAGGILVETAPGELVIAGNGIIATFAPWDPQKSKVSVGLESVDEGRVSGGRFVVGHRLNGDETHQGRQVRLPLGALGVQRVKVYTFR
jgi:beta-galactosidase GanA